MYQANITQKQVNVFILISYVTDFESKIICYKNHDLLIKGTSHIQEDNPKSIKLIYFKKFIF